MSLFQKQCNYFYPFLLRTISQYTRPRVYSQAISCVRLYLCCIHSLSAEWEEQGKHSLFDLFMHYSKEVSPGAL